MIAARAARVSALTDRHAPTGSSREGGGGHVVIRQRGASAGPIGDGEGEGCAVHSPWGGGERRGVGNQPPREGETGRFHAPQVAPAAAAGKLLGRATMHLSGCAGARPLAFLRRKSVPAGPHGVRVFRCLLPCRANSLKKLEVRAGIEPTFADLQSAASPLCHRTPGAGGRVYRACARCGQARRQPDKTFKKVFAFFSKRSACSFLKKRTKKLLSV